MPIKQGNRARYPQNWATEIRPSILERAGNRCERCSVPNHAVGYRDQDGSFVPLRGNAPCDAAGDGKSWSSYGLISYADALAFAEQYNEHAGNRWIVIVLTIAHIHDPDPANCDPGNLQALCQRCHNMLDAPMRAANARASRRSRRACGDLFANA